jgi:hypothetical protein
MGISSLMSISCLVVIQTLVYGFVLWFGLFLLTRSTERKLHYTGIGLGMYALALAFDLLGALSLTSEQNDFFLRIHWGILLLPSVFWTGAAIQLFPEESNQKDTLKKIWQWVLPVGLILSSLYFWPNVLWSPPSQLPNLAGYLVFAGMSILPLIIGIWVIKTTLRGWQQTGKEIRRAVGLILTAALFFALGSGIVLLQFDWFPHTWVILALSFDLELLGFAVAYLDAFEQSESLWPDFIRSFAASALAALVFGGQVAFAMAISTGITLPMVILLLTTIGVAILTQVFADPIQICLDRLVFARFPRLHQERAELRAVAATLPRRSDAINLLALDEAEFSKLTRRALSHFGDLPKLASSPLTRLPIIETRLIARGAPINTLERASELKILLAESIERLKPSASNTHNTSDEWRFYNALYYPYIIGFRLYGRRPEYPIQSKEIQTILTWFRTTVPERTLYNWQNAAAALIAKDLREQNTH